MSVDSPDPICEAICAKFLDDPRFKLVVQPIRLGWVGQVNWLLKHVTNEFWYYHQQDDLTDPRYLEVLVEHARSHSSAALVYCDIEPIGRITGEIFQAPSVLGVTPFARVVTMLQEHFPAFAFRGLTRASALSQAGSVTVNAVENFGVDITWLTGVARCGELHRVPQVLYRKRYHDRNTENLWWSLDKPEQLRSWAHHCVDMLGQALKVRGSPQQSRLLWQAVLSRLTAPESAGRFMKVDALTSEERASLLTQFLDRAQATYPTEVSLFLDAQWPDIRRWSNDAFWIPRTDPLTIEAFGPSMVVAGESFNVQPNGQSALWVKASRSVPPGTTIRLGNTQLATVVDGTTVTALVPAPVTAHPGDLALVLLALDGQALSNTVVFSVTAKANVPIASRVRAWRQRG